MYTLKIIVQINSINSLKKNPMVCLQMSFQKLIMIQKKYFIWIVKVFLGDQKYQEARLSSPTQEKKIRYIVVKSICFWKQ